MPSRWGEARGSVTAELVVALPALMLVCALCLNGVAAVGVRVQLIDQSQMAARLLGRGESEVQARSLVAGAELSVSREAPLVCLSATRQFGPFVIRTRSCAFDEAR